MIKGIIFDLDGTTLNTIDDIQNCLNIVLKNNNLPIKTYDEVRINLGQGSRNLIKFSIKEKDNNKLIDKLTKEYLELYKVKYNIKTKPYDGIKELINELKVRNIKLAINTNKPNNIALNIISQHFPGNIFDIIIGSRDSIPNKPDPYSANEIVKFLELNKEDVLYVGDSETDIKTAKNAGLKSVGCLWGFRDLETLKKENTDIIISKPKELLNYL